MTTNEKKFNTWFQTQGIHLFMNSELPLKRALKELAKEAWDASSKVPSKRSLKKLHWSDDIKD